MEFPLWRKIPLFPVSVEIVDDAALLSNMSRILQKIFILGIWWVPTTLSWPPYRAIARFTPGNGLPVARDLPISHIYTIKISAEISGLTVAYSPCFVNTNDHPPMIYDLNRFRCLLMIAFSFWSWYADNWVFSLDKNLIYRSNTQTYFLNSYSEGIFLLLFVKEIQNWLFFQQ